MENVRQSGVARQRLWLIFGRTDVVATACGKIIPGDRVNIMQPSETAIVKTTHVTEGQPVRAGDPLIDLEYHHHRCGRHPRAG